ncbi:400_t:CDS:2 [Ambispora leptoticha]|uniref:400_t:CDS:1 n=1 Tax=Ambispora leptoticha TaxID=144679 RepID=A0A9N9G9K0_9GLOM|nr:400_t:CDS:2 [Ambispora leptoticha]
MHVESGVLMNAASVVMRAIQTNIDAMIERSGGKNEYEYKIEVKTEKVRDEKGGIEISESLDNKVLNEREDGAVVPTVKENYKGNKEEVSENLTEEEEIILRSRISSRRLTDGGQVNFVEYQQITPMEADKEQLKDLKKRVEAELEIRAKVEESSSNSSSQTLNKAGKGKINTFIKQVLEEKLIKEEKKEKEKLRQQLIKGYQAVAKSQKRQTEDEM